MEASLWILKFIIGPVVAVIVTLLVSEPLKTRLAPIVSRFGSKKQEGITGKWKTTFFYGENEVEYVEVLELSALLGNIVGHVIPHELNHKELKKVESEKPLRLRGEIKDNRFLTGIWFHPSSRNHHQGAFKLLINTNNEAIGGTWLGYSERKNIIEDGRWEWERLE